MELIILILLGYAIWALLKLVQTTPKDIGDKGEDAVRKLLLRSTLTPDATPAASAAKKQTPIS